MNAALIMVAVGLAAQQAEISTVDDRVVTGTLAAFDQKSVVIEADGRQVSIPLDSLLEIRFSKESAATRPDGDAGIGLQLADGSRLTCKQVVIQDRIVIADTEAAGRLETPVKSVRSLRFRASDAAVEKKWAELSESGPDRDLLVVRNGEVLDRLEGTVSALDEKTLTFLTGDTSVPIDRTKPRLFGVVFSHSPEAKDAGLCELKFLNGDRLTVKSLAVKPGTLEAVLTGGSVTIPIDLVAAIDFGRGKIEYLSQLEPREIQHTPLIGTDELDSVFTIRRDRSDAGPDAPIRIDGKSYTRGLVIHSRTRLTYRLNGDYRRFVAVAGIEQLVRPNGNVTLTISADGKQLFDGPVTGTDSPIPLDLDVSGVRELVVLVDFGKDWDIGDHLALGDARLIK